MVQENVGESGVSLAGCLGSEITWKNFSGRHGEWMDIIISVDKKRVEITSFQDRSPCGAWLVTILQGTFVRLLVYFFLPRSITIYRDKVPFLQPIMICYFSRSSSSTFWNSNTVYLWTSFSFVATSSLFPIYFRVLRTIWLAVLDWIFLSKIVCLQVWYRQT